MLKYKNVTEGILKFRAHDGKMVKKVFELKPNQEVELGSEARFGGLELVKEEANKKSKKKKIGDE